MIFKGLTKVLKGLIRGLRIDIRGLKGIMRGQKVYLGIFITYITSDAVIASHSDPLLLLVVSDELLTRGI